MLIYELKLLASGYKKILAGIIFLAVFCAIFWLVAEAFAGSEVISPFTIGVVDNDNTSEIDLLIQMFQNTEGINQVVWLEKMSEKEAELKLLNDEIPAFIVIPPNFTQDIITGKNSPLQRVGNENRMLQLTTAKLLVNAGVAYLTASQSGIYATLDYAYENGMEWDEIQNKIVMSINIEYIKVLLGYKDYFEKTEVSPTGGLPRDKYYFNSAVMFLMNIFLVTLMSTLFSSTGKDAMNRYRLCGRSVVSVMAVKLLALWLVLTVLLLPLAFVYGAGIIAAGLMLSGFALMSAKIFKSELAAGLFLFTAALVSMFAAGGVLPLSYLPAVFGKISVVLPHFWFIRINMYGSELPSLFLAAFGCLCFFVAVWKARRECSA